MLIMVIEFKNISLKGLLFRYLEEDRTHKGLSPV